VVERQLAVGDRLGPGQAQSAIRTHTSVGPRTSVGPHGAVGSRATVRRCGAIPCAIGGGIAGLRRGHTRRDRSGEILERGCHPIARLLEVGVG
jgi:hypothetical protein